MRNPLDKVYTIFHNEFREGYITETKQTVTGGHSKIHTLYGISFSKKDESDVRKLKEDVFSTPEDLASYMINKAR